MSSFKLLLIFSVLAVSLRSIWAISPEERKKVQEDTIPVLEECSAKFNISIDDIRKAKDSGSLKYLDPCVFACIFKIAEMIDDEGLYHADKSKDITDKYLSDEADVKKINGVFTICKSVNEHNVSDGEKGCERSALLFECLLPLKDMFDY